MLQVFLRAFGRFNLTLWDDVFAEFQPLTDNDVIVFNFGAWYPRYNVHESGCAPASALHVFCMHIDVAEGHVSCLDTQ